MATGHGFRIEGTWLRSRLARRIFLMFCAVAFVPAALVFALTWRQADGAIDASQQRGLRAETRFVAFTLLSRLQSGDALLARIADTGQGPGGDDARVFESVVRRPLDPAVDVASLPRLRVSTDPASRSARVVLLAPRRRDGAGEVYIGVVSPQYLWRDDDVMDGMRVCVSSGAHRIGCAGRVARGARILRERWELDLRTEFGADAWRFDAERESEPAAVLQQLRWFAPLAAGVLLMAMLMSLVQIRRTLVPLEALMARIRLFSGTRRPVDVRRAPDELAALSATFDDMRERIGAQLARLRGLSAVDAQILTRAPLCEVLEGVASQLRAFPRVGGAAVVIEPIANGPRDVVLAPESGALDRDAALDVIASQDHGAMEGDGWCATPAYGADASIKNAWCCLRIGTPGEPCAWIVLRAEGREPLDDGVLDAARQLADRIAIALALDARERRLVYQAHHDALTGLPNRLAAIETLDAVIAAAAGPFAVVFMDLDRFKSVNDGLGHALGDGLLAGVAERLRGALPPGDLVARFGGDEFVLLLHGMAHPRDLDAMQARIDEAFAAPVVLGGHAMAIRYSAGVAFHPADGATAHDLVRKADMAMYRAKQDGGGRFALYSSGMDEAAREEVELVAALRLALAEGALDVHYQPRIDTNTGAWAGLEALVRWQDGMRGWVPPSRFVPLAEEHGLIDALGEFVLRAASRQVAAWRGAGLEPGRVAINVSSEQLRAGTLVDDIARVLHDTGARWSDLEVEITESVLVADAEATAHQLQALRELGVTVAIDDFGTGYSSLAYLARLPLDTIKIDRAFVVSLQEPGTASVIRSVLALAAALDKRVITEGVETESQLRVLQSWGCDVFQGYLFHRPMPAGEVQALLEAQAGGVPGPVHTRSRI